MNERSLRSAPDLSAAETELEEARAALVRARRRADDADDLRISHGAHIPGYVSASRDALVGIEAAEARLAAAEANFKAIQQGEIR